MKKHMENIAIIWIWLTIFMFLIDLDWTRKTCLQGLYFILSIVAATMYCVAAEINDECDN